MKSFSACLAIGLCLSLAVSCAAKREADFFLADEDGARVALHASQDAADGRFGLSRPAVYDYASAAIVPVPANRSLIIEYSVSNEEAGNDGAAEVIARIDDAAWILPLDLSFLGMTSADTGAVPGTDFRMAYAVPLEAGRIRGISFEVRGGGTRAGDTDSEDTSVEMRLEGLRVTRRVYGFDIGGDVPMASPFVSRASAGGAGADTSVAAPVTTIAPPEGFSIYGSRSLLIGGIRGQAQIDAGGQTFRYTASVGTLPPQSLTVPAAFLPEDGGKIGVSGSIASALLSASPESPFIAADPGFILLYPQDRWRDRNFEVFRWETFPSILIFDTASYAFQDRMFKRLAFFSEKKGFKGRLAADEEIAGLHGWNAHDYSAETAARFFDAAEKAAFNLLDEERLLRRLLLDAGVIRTADGGFAVGEGAFISISRESPEYLRLTFMAHEGFHGIFFIDADFREFCRKRLDGLDAAARRFLLSYFDYQQYDINDPYLVLNEFMAHCLQQGVTASGRYFGETLAGRLYERSPWRRPALPPRDAAGGNWPLLAGAFRMEAAALSQYAASRWGLAAGRVWRVSRQD